MRRYFRGVLAKMVKKTNKSLLMYDEICKLNEQLWRIKLKMKTTLKRDYYFYCDRIVWTKVLSRKFLRRLFRNYVTHAQNSRKFNETPYFLNGKQ